MRRISGAMAVALSLMGSPLAARAQGMPQAQAQGVGITQLPPAVQDTFLAEIGNGRVEDLRLEATANGVSYVGKVIDEGKATDIEVDPKGVVVKRSQPRAETPVERALDR